MSSCFCVCVTVWEMRVCVHASVCQKKDSHSRSRVCVGVGGGTLSHSAGGKLLSFSFGSSIICISCHPPFSFFSEAEQTPPDPPAQRELVKTQIRRRCPPAFRHNPDPKIWCRAAQIISLRVLRTSVFEAESCLPVIGYLY